MKSMRLMLISMCRLNSMELSLAENADVESGKVNVTVEGLPGDYQAEYTVEGLEDVQVKTGYLPIRQRR